MDPSVSVRQLQDYLRDVMLTHVSARNELLLLDDEFDRLNTILKDASQKQLTGHKTFWEVWVKQISKVASHVEETIRGIAAAERTSSGSLPNRGRLNLAGVVRDLTIGTVQPFLKRLNLVAIWIADLPEDTNIEQQTTRKSQITKRIVGFEDEASTLIDYLNEESNKLETFVITGMPGLGKTALAWKIFEDPRIKSKFPVRIWVSISDHPNMENVLQTILRKFTAKKPNVSVEELTSIVREYLRAGKFLMVMDDVWTANMWNEVKAFLPMDNKLGRVLITSRNKDVADKSRNPYSLRFLDRRKSWELLQFNIYGKLDVVPRELVKVGQAIAQNCMGLPLSVIVIAGILVDKMSSAGDSIASIRSEWNKVSECMKTYLLSENWSPLRKSISLSYTNLPCNLRNCFLYLGTFPEDADIYVNKLIRLWIAEGFIRGESTGKSLEQIAKDNLKYLINQNLVMVKESKPSGVAKICYVHEVIREFCKAEGAFDSLNLFQEICKLNRESFELSEDKIAKCRRLCIHSHVLDFVDFLTQKQTVSKACSFLCFHKSAINLDLKDVIDGFTLLRVYSAENIRLPKFPPKLSQLVHLRYLTLGIANNKHNTIPETISNLWNLQTLTVTVSSCTLEIQANIWNLKQLRHLHTRASIILKNVDGMGEGGDNLQTLGRLSPGSCSDRVLTKAKNLITLGIQGDLSSTHLELRGLEKLALLNKLKLVHMVMRGVASERPMPCLPENNKFPPSLKILVLVGTYLHWEQMAILGRLNKLEELKLKENACRGYYWKVPKGFEHLKLLHIERLSDLTFWSMQDGDFPQLRYLLLEHCGKLLQVPSVLGATLELLRMEGVTKEAVICAEEIEKQRKGTKGGVTFKLDIDPADKTRMDQ